MKEELKERESKAEKLIEELEKQKNEHKQILLEQKQVLEEMRQHVDEEKKARAANPPPEVAFQQQQQLQQQQMPVQQVEAFIQPQQPIGQMPQAQLKAYQAQAFNQQDQVVQQLEPVQMQQQPNQQQLLVQQQQQVYQLQQEQVYPVQQQQAYPVQQQAEYVGQQFISSQPQVQQPVGVTQGANQPVQVNKLHQHPGEFLQQVIVNQQPAVGKDSLLYQQQLLQAQQQILQEQQQLPQLPPDAIPGQLNLDSHNLELNRNSDDLVERKEMKRSIGDDDEALLNEPPKFECLNCHGSQLISQLV